MSRGGRSSYLQVQNRGVWSLQEFAVIKWSTQQTVVVMLHSVLMSGFIFYAQIL